LDTIVQDPTSITLSNLELKFDRKRGSDEIAIADSRGNVLLKGTKDSNSWSVSNDNQELLWFARKKLVWNEDAKTILGDINSERMFAIGCVLNRLTGIDAKL